MTIEKIRTLFRNNKFNSRPNAIPYIFREKDMIIASVPEYAGTYYIFQEGDNFYLSVQPGILHDDFLITVQNTEIILTARSSNTGIPFVILTPVG
jgi:hypothetical protein